MKPEIKAVNKYRTPKYPAQEQVRVNPELLKALPQRWQQHAALYTAVAMTAAIGLTACAGPKKETPTSAADKETTTAGTTTTTVTTTVAVQEARNLRIPVFSHGDGRIGYGCVMVVPAIILNEEDAYEIITDEAGKRGVNFKNYLEYSEEGGNIDGTFPATDLDNAGVSGSWEGTLYVDGYDEERKIGFEYVSMSDMNEWSSVGSSTVSRYGYKVTAEELAKTVENTAVFYDPGAAPDYSYTDELKASGMTRSEYIEEYEKRGYKLAEELLRQQVRDFLDWLAAEGVI